jgi:hypothetical protein
VLSAFDFFCRVFRSIHVVARIALISSRPVRALSGCNVTLIIPNFEYERLGALIVCWHS